MSNPDTDSQADYAHLLADEPGGGGGGPPTFDLGPWLERVNALEDKHQAQVRAIEMELFRAIVAIAESVTDAHEAMNVYYAERRAALRQYERPYATARRL